LNFVDYPSRPFDDYVKNNGGQFTWHAEMHLVEYNPTTNQIFVYGGYQWGWTVKVDAYANASVEYVESQDPNAKIGPGGYGAAGYVQAAAQFPYTVEFENARTASAPAQQVVVTDQLDPHLDWNTLQFTGVGFGANIIAIPANTQYYQTTVSMTYNDETFDVDITLDLNLATGLVSAEFQSIDPSTNLPPSNVLTGFLPPEDGTGRGQGYFSYTVQANAGLPTGTQIRNVALVSFDGQPQIATDQVNDEDPSQGIDPAKECLNTIDATPPTSTVASLPATETQTSFTVNWSGQDLNPDGSTGSGVALYNVYVSDDGGQPTLWQSATTQTSATYPGVNGHTYAFYSVATDNVGNQETKSTTAEATTLVNASSSPAVVIDDCAGVPAWTVTGTWSNWTNQGCDGDVHQAAPAATADSTATWSFSNLSPGQYYRVETTWTPNSNRASNAPYTISGGTATLPVYVNQKLAPVGVSANGETWQELGVYQASATGTLAVTLANNANGYVIADAVRLEPVPAGGPAIMVQAGTGSVADPVVLPTLSGTVQTTVSFAAVAAGAASPQETFTVFNGGGGPLSVSSVSVPTGYTFVAGTGFSSSGTATVLPGDSAQFVLQEYTSTVGTLGGTVTLATNDSTENPFSFPVTGMVISPIIDDCAGAPLWTTTGTWSNWTDQGCDGDVHQAAPAATADSTATWTFTGLGPGQYYRVETTWTTNGAVAISNRASNAPYTISGGTVTLPVYVNQKLAPVGVSAKNETWQELGVYQASATGTLAVNLANNADGYVIADAVRLELVSAAGPAIVVQAGTGSASDAVVLPTLSGTVQTTVSFGTVVAFSVSQKTFTVFNGGGGTLSVSSVSAPNGYTFVAGSGFSSSGAATVLPGDSAQFVLEESTSAPGTLGGTVTLATNDVVTLASGSPSGSFSFPVTGTVIPGLIINDNAAAPGFTTTGTWGDWTSQGYYDGDDHQAAAAGATATWTFSNLTPGSTYDVYVTWPAQSNRAKDVPYTVTVNGGATPLTVDQTIAPPTSVAGSAPGGGAWSWFQLGTSSFTVGPDGTVAVEVSNNGLPPSTDFAYNVEADAAMLVPVQGEFAAGGVGHNSRAAALTASEAMPLVQEAEVRWAAAGASVSALGSVQVVVGNLPGTELGESSSAVDTIFLDSNAQGYGWFIDPTPGQDAEFPVQVAKTEERATSGPAAGEMDLLTVMMHEMGHFLGHEDLDPQAFPYDLMSADLAVGVRRLPGSAVAAAAAQGSSAQTQAGGQGGAAAQQAQAKDAVFAALVQPQGGTTADKTAGGGSNAWWLLYGEE
jgi:hypothetical protein